MLKSATLEHGGFQRELGRKSFFYFFDAGYCPRLEIDNARPAIGKNINPVGAPAEREISLANFQREASLYFRNDLSDIAAQCSFVLDDPSGEALESRPPEAHDFRIVPEGPEYLFAKGDELLHRIVRQGFRIEREKVANGLVEKRAAQCRIRCRRNVGQAA